MSFTCARLEGMTALPGAARNRVVFHAEKAYLDESPV